MTPGWQAQPAATALLFCTLLLQGFSPSFAHSGDPTTGSIKQQGVLEGLEWLTTPSIRQDAQVYMGSQARLRTALDRYMKGGNISLTFIGGSITAGHGVAVDGKSYPAWVQHMLRKTLDPQRLKITNSAVPGTRSAYMSVCLNVHVPRDTDIVFIEYTLNDPERPVGPSLDNPTRRPYERLLRKTLSFPNNPAVILVHSFQWFGSVPGAFWANSEREFHEFALYYRLPELSVKAACWRPMQSGIPGFQVHRSRRRKQEEPAGVVTELKGKVFYWDNIHPDGSTGHRIMAELVVQALLDAIKGLEEHPIGKHDLEQASEHLPSPMLPKNFASITDKCFIGSVFTATVIENNGFFWKDEGHHHHCSKLGYISDAPGSQLKMQINTTSPTGNQGNAVIVTLAYLKSYVNMGKAVIGCVAGCTCNETLLDGHNDLDKTSQLHLHEFTVTQSDACIATIRVLQETRSGKHKVKIAGVMISDELTEGSISGWGAVQTVHEAVSQANNGVANFMVP